MFSKPDSDNHHDHGLAADVVDDPIAFALDRQAAVACQLSDKRFPLFLGRPPELFSALEDHPLDTLVVNLVEQPGRGGGPLDRVDGFGHRPRRARTSSCVSRSPFSNSSMLSRRAVTSAGSLRMSRVSMMFSYNSQGINTRA